VTLFDPGPPVCPVCGGRGWIYNRAGEQIPCPECKRKESSGPLPPGNEGLSLVEARNILAAGLETGTRCLCCGQYAQIHRWTLYATAARLLVRLYEGGNTTEFVESKPIKGKGQGDGARLRYWNLAEEEKERRPDGGKSGWWRVTPYGEDFIRSRATIPKYVYVYDNTVLPYSDAHPQGGRRTISEVLKVPFNYGDHMNWTD
jgi:hypothetical protein